MPNTFVPNVCLKCSEHISIVYSTCCKQLPIGYVKRSKQKSHLHAKTNVKYLRQIFQIHIRRLRQMLLIKDKFVCQDAPTGHLSTCLAPFHIFICVQGAAQTPLQLLSLRRCVNERPQARACADSHALAQRLKNVRTHKGRETEQHERELSSSHSLKTTDFPFSAAPSVGNRFRHAHVHAFARTRNMQETRLARICNTS